MNRESLITLTFLTFLFIGVTIYNNQNASGRYQYIRNDNLLEVMDTKEGLMYSSMVENGKTMVMVRNIKTGEIEIFLDDENKIK